MIPYKRSIYISVFACVSRYKLLVFDWRKGFMMKKNDVLWQEIPPFYCSKIS